MEDETKEVKLGSVCVGLKLKNGVWAADFCSYSRPLQPDENPEAAMMKIYELLKETASHMEPAQALPVAQNRVEQRIDQLTQVPSNQYQLQQQYPAQPQQQAQPHPSYGMRCPRCGSGTMIMYDKFKNLCCSNGFPGGKWNAQGCQEKIMNRNKF